MSFSAARSVKQMKLRVLVVDDSSFFRKRLNAILGADPLLEVVGNACDGAQAVALDRELRPDVITMDVEMPGLGGIDAVRSIVAERDTPILMLSALTTEGARATLDALEAGAMDFLPKQFPAGSGDPEQAAETIRRRVATLGLLGRRRLRRSEHATDEQRSAAAQRAPAIRQAPAAVDIRRYDLVLIGASTGGPAALQNILTGLPGQFPVPLAVVQHMPATFTPLFAQRLDQLARIEVVEARDAEPLRAGAAYVAPGGRQFEIARADGQLWARVREAPAGANYRPSIDAAFQAAAEQCSRRVLAVVLTGMGRDGCEGARHLKQRGSTVWAQDETSSLIYGMPKAVVAAGVADEVLSLQQIADSLQGAA